MIRAVLIPALCFVLFGSQSAPAGADEHLLTAEAPIADIMWVDPPTVRETPIDDIMWVDPPTVREAPTFPAGPVGSRPGILVGLALIALTLLSGRRSALRDSLPARHHAGAANHIPGRI